MREKICRIAALLAFTLPGTGGNAAEIKDSARFDGASAPDRESLTYLQCVPYARQISGIQIYGDALTWWDQAEGRYAKGRKPKPGAVMSFAPSGRMELGHVAAVSRVIDSRTVLLRHANWSPIDGRRGQIEDNVRAVDVSEQNDWSQVRVWFAPIGNLGTTAWPVNGFIYPEKPGKQKGFTLLAAKPVTKAADAPKALVGADFLKGIRPEVDARAAPARRQLTMSYGAPKATSQKPVASGSSRSGAALSNDPIGRIIAAKTR
ncbi:MAG: CHAP domain-containing protein [Novosphingobium sp.]|uniref:CHAP domain-containing protein n=1 Tax=Novosphingobium sp. TaxID=1874826 RepID=UPI0027331E31|nr:CHAP domain-containing protein [Novosphingobium sp.]MDP3548920.1 CHAP domain-containing protein [Novosphingobium sp.]